MHDEGDDVLQSVGPFQGCCALECELCELWERKQCRGSALKEARGSCWPGTGLLGKKVQRVEEAPCLGIQPPWETRRWKPVLGLKEEVLRAAVACEQQQREEGAAPCGVAGECQGSLPQNGKKGGWVSKVATQNVEVGH